MPLLKGGYPFYGKPVGIIMLECAFPRPLGDIGHALTFPFPVHYEVLEGVLATQLIHHGEKAAVDSLLKAAKRLERLGMRVILTSCGLLIRYQSLLAEAVRVPVATSSLLLLPFLSALLPKDRKIGVLTADASALDPDLLQQVGWDQPNRVVIRGMQGCDAFRKGILEPEPPYELDVQRICEETLSVGRQLLVKEPRIGALLLECTNLAPYSVALRRALSIPVFDVTQLAQILYAGIDENAPASG